MCAGHKEQFFIDSKDDAVRQATVVHNGELKWPPPALPAPPPPKVAAAHVAKEAAPLDPYKVTYDNALAVTGGVTGIMALSAVSPSALLSRAACLRCSEDSLGTSRAH